MPSSTHAASADPYKNTVDQALVRLAVGDLKGCETLLSTVPAPARRLDRPPTRIAIASYYLPTVFKDILAVRQDRPADPANPDRPAIDIAGLLMMSLVESDFDFNTRTSSFEWAKNPVQVIDMARKNAIVSALETGHEPVVSPVICALLAGFVHLHANRPADTSMVNMAAAIKAGYAIGDPCLLASAVFHPAGKQESNGERLRAVLPLLPSPLPGPVRDVLWCNALRADTSYASASPPQSSCSASGPGLCQQMLLDLGIKPALDPATPDHSDLFAQAFACAADHMLAPIKAAMAGNHGAALGPAMMLKLVHAISGQRYNPTEQSRIVRMIEAFDFTGQAMKILATPLPGRKANTVLHNMIDDGSFVLARKFIRMGAATHLVNKAGKTPLMCSKKRSPRMLKQLRALASMAPMQDKDRQFMLFKACRARDVELACKMMDEGADLFGIQGRHDVIEELFIDLPKLAGAKQVRAQAALQSIVAHHIQIHGRLGIDQANRLLQRAAPAACDIIARMALDNGADPHVLGGGLGITNNTLARKNAQGFIKLMTVLAEAGIDPDYRTNKGELLFGVVWDDPAFSRAVNALESSRAMEQAVAQAAQAVPSKSSTPRF